MISQGKIPIVREMESNVLTDESEGFEEVEMSNTEFVQTIVQTIVL